MVTFVGCPRFTEQMMMPFVQDNQTFLRMPDFFICLQTAFQRNRLIFVSMQDQYWTVDGSNAVTAVFFDINKSRIKTFGTVISSSLPSE